MRDSLMLSSLTVGEKQHPKLGGCVRVFFQLFDWNRRLSCKKRVFSQKQLPAERLPLRRASSNYKDGRVAAPFITDVEPMLLITNGEEGENLHIKLDCCMDETGGEDIRDSEDVMHEAVTNSSGLFSEKESTKGSALKVKDPGVIGRLMGLEYLPSPQCENKQKKVSLISHTTVHDTVDPSSLLQTPTVIIPQDATKHKVHNFALEHGLPHEELNALLAELNGNMCTILSALPPHLGISSSGPNSASRIHSTTRMNSRTGASSPSSPCPSRLARTHVNTTSGVSSPASTSLATTVTRTHVNTTTGAPSPSSTCPATMIRTHVNTTTGASSPSSTCPATMIRTDVKTTTVVSTCPGTIAPRTSVNISNAPVSSEQSFIRAPSYKPERQKLGKSKHLEGAQSIESQVMYEGNDLSELEEQMVRCPRDRDGDVGTIKGVKRVKGKSTSVDGKRVSELGCVNASSIEGARSVEVKLQELADVGRSTCKPWRRKKIDREVVGVRGTSSDHHRGAIHSQNLPSIPPATNFDIKYNVAFFDEYHSSKSSLKHSIDDHGLDRAKQSKLITAASESLASHYQRTSLDCSNSVIAGVKQEEFSLMRVLLQRRAAREAAADAALEAAGILETESHAAADNSSMACKYGSESLQGMISSCSTSSPLDTDLAQRREKLSAGRSEAGGGNFLQIPHPIIGVEYSRSAARRCLHEDSCTGDDNGSAQGKMGNIMADHGMERQCTKSCVANERAHDGACMQQRAYPIMQVEICSAANPAGTGKNTTAAILQDVICALNSSQSTPHSKPVSTRPHHHRHHYDDDVGTPSTTADGNETESTSDSGVCWAAASQPSPVSVLVSPFDDDASPAGHDTCWIQSEEDYVAALLAATSESGTPPAELFTKLEERVEAAWPDSEVPPTRGYRRLVFDCVREALSEAVASKECKGNRRWRARVLFEEMCRWRQEATEIMLDDLVEADLAKPCNRWLAFEVHTQDIVVVLQGTIFELLVEELVCDLVLS